MRNREIDRSFIKAIFNIQGKHPNGRVDEEVKQWIFKIVRNECHSLNMKIEDLSEEPMWFETTARYDDAVYTIKLYDKKEYIHIVDNFYLHYNIKTSAWQLHSDF